MFIQARNYTPAQRDSIRLIVVHTMENPEKPGTARAVAQWFASAGAPLASAHACVDNREVVLCVKPHAIAWAAPGANRDGYQIEHAGRAAQSPEQWADDYSEAMLRLSAEHAAEIVHAYGVPIRKHSADEVRDGAAGFCGHVEVTKAYRKSTHTDPGPHFPWEHYLELVTNALARMNGLAESPTDPAPPPDNP
jgi:N-acetyl-anhydromuramyl-L-alanine amidase AmpD